MNTPTILNDRERLQTVLAALNVAMDAHKDIIASDHPEAAKLRDYVFQFIGKLHRERQRLERAITKASLDKKAKNHG